MATTGADYLSLNQEAQSPNQALFPVTASVTEQGNLSIGGCDVTTLVENYGSPLYILDEETLRTTCRLYRDSFKQYYPGESQVIYASKAWSCLTIASIVHSEAIGFDVVSGGELYTTLKAGVSGDQIYFHGNNKSLDELQYAIDANCTIIIDNELELKTLITLSENKVRTPVKVMLRITPGIECHTHEYIRTGHLDSKFGFDPNQVDAIFSLISQHPSINCIGLHAHIGSQIFERQPHQDLTGVLVEWMKKAHTYGLSIEQLNIGGGLGIRYTEQDDPPSIQEWVSAVSQAMIKACKDQNIPFPKLIAEPGRSLIGTACVTAYTVGSTKTVPEIRSYIAVDGGMSDNPRPITYQSLYRSVIANRMNTPCSETVTVAGKHCESGDILIKDASLPPVESGDILVVPATGAYNYSMASNYNRITRPAGVLVSQGVASLFLKRESYEDLLRQDCIPQRLLAV